VGPFIGLGTETAEDSEGEVIGSRVGGFSSQGLAVECMERPDFAGW